MKTMFLVFALLMISACAPKPEPYTVQACIDGKQVAEFRDACLGERPADGVPPTDSQYDSDKCSTIQLRVGQFCDSPAAVPAEAVINP